LTIPVEVRNREFDAKLLLACIAAERGFSVILGFKREIHLRMASLPRSIYMGLSLTRRELQKCDLLRKLGHTIVSLDEEAIIYLSPEMYLERRVGPRAFGRVDALLAWGPDNARNWRASPDYEGTPIHQTGNPRVDLLRPELRPFWKSGVERLREQFGRFVLINSNFGRLNHFRPGKSEQLNTLTAAAADSSSVSEADAGLAAHRHALLQHFLAIVGELARDHPHTTIVVRPHPGEDRAIWLQAAAGCSNVHVVYEGPVTPWLLAAEVVIHNGCTTGVEAYQLGKLAVAYQPVTSERFELDLPNKLSRQVFDLEALRDAVAAALARETDGDPGSSAVRRALADRYFAAMDGRLAAQRTVAILEELDDAPEMGRRPPLRTYLAGKSQAIQRRLQRQYNALVRGSRSPTRQSRHEYHRHIFPPTTVGDVEARIARFQLALGRFSAVSVRSRSTNVFEITSA